MVVDVEKIISMPRDLLLIQRYQLGDQTVGPFGEPFGQFDFIVSYDAPLHSNLSIIPIGWDLDEELEPNVDKDVEVYQGQQEKIDKENGTSKPLN